MKRLLQAALALASASTAMAQVAAPTITSLSPSSRVAGSGSFTLSVSGSNFRPPAANCPTPAPPQSLILWNGLEQSGTTYSAAASIVSAPIPASYIAAAGTAQVQVRNRSCSIGGPPSYTCTCTNIGDSNALTFTITQPLTASCNNPPQATPGLPYTHRLAAAGGSPPYYWSLVSASSPQLRISSDGAVSGVFSQSDGPVVSFTAAVMDSTERSVTISCQIVVASVPVITAYSPREATACGPGFTLSVQGSNFLPGVRMGIGGPEVYQSLSTEFLNANALNAVVLREHIATAGTVNVVAANQAATGAQFVWSDPRPFTIKRTPRIQTVTPARATVGSADLQVTLTGADFVSGVTRVQWQSGTSTELVPVTRWTATEMVIVVPRRLLASAGRAQIRAVNIEAANPNGEVYPDACSPPAVFTVESPTLQLDAVQLAAATVGVDYRATFTATGGTTPYRFTLISGAVPGLSLAADGVLSGRPAQAGSFPFRVQVTDASSPQQSAQRDFTLRVDPPALSITSPESLAGARVGADYSVSFTASGGTPPYTWQLLGQGPPGLSLSAAGVLSGRPQQAGAFTLRVQVSDSAPTPLRSQRDYTLTIAASNLAVASPAALQPAMVGQAYNVTFTATGGAAPYRWDLQSGSVPGLTMSAAGVLSGTPARDGSYTLVARVTDANSLQATQSYTLTVRLPNATATLTAPAQPSSPTDQPTLTLRLGEVYPVEVSGQLRISFAPNASGLPAGYMDPALRFAAGGTTLPFTVPANSMTVPLPQNGAIQLGSVAGTITVTLDQLRAAGTNTDVPMSSRPTVTINVPRMAPVIVPSSVAITGLSSGGFAVELDAYSTPRDLRSATFTFSAASGARLEGQTAHTVQLTSESASWFSSADGRSNGSRFHLRVPFTLSGTSTAVGSVSVTLENSAGVSSAVSGGVR